MLQVDIKRYPNIGVIKLKGNFIQGEIKNFESRIKNIIENYNEIGVSFEDVEFIDSAGLGQLIQLYKHIKEKKTGEMYIFGINNEIKDVFETSQLDRYFKIMNKRDFDMEFIGYEYEMNFKVHEPIINIEELMNTISAKVSINTTREILKTKNDGKLFFEEDTNIYKRGKEIQENDLDQLEKRGYCFMWISSQRNTPPEGSKEEFIREVRLDLELALTDLYKIFDESNIRKSSKGTLKYFDGTDLFRSQLNPLQKEGAQKLYYKLLGDSSKITQIKTLLEKIIHERVTQVSIQSSRSIGTTETLNSPGFTHSRMDEFTNSIITKSVDSAIMFLATCNRIFGQRAIRGHQVSSKRLEKGDKKGFDKHKRSQFPMDLILNAAYGILFHDYGFNHSKLRELVEKELKILKNNDGKYIKNNDKRLSEEERVLMKRHIYVAHNIMSSDPDSMYASAIADNIIKFHHCMLDGNGFPDRKHYTENGIVKFQIPLHELTRLFSIINFYMSFLDRKPYRLPLRRDNLVKYILDNSVPNLDPTGKPDPEGIWDLDTTLKQPGLFDGFLVKEFFKTINVYKEGESVVLRNENTNNTIPASIFTNNHEKPHRPTVNVYVKDKWGKIDLNEPNYSDWFIDDLHETLILV